MYVRRRGFGEAISLVNNERTNEYANLHRLYLKYVFTEFDAFAKIFALFYPDFW